MYSDCCLKCNVKRVREIKKLTYEQKKKVENNKGLIASVLKKYGIMNDNREFDDYFSIGAIGLCKAALNFNDSGKMSFSSYAFKKMEYEILMEFRNRKKSPETVNNLEIVLRNRYYFPEKYEEIEEETAFSQVLKNNRKDFTKVEIEVLTLFKKGFSENEIALKMNKSNSCISEAKSCAIKKFIKFLNN